MHGHQTGITDKGKESKNCFHFRSMHMRVNLRLVKILKIPALACIRVLLPAPQRAKNQKTGELENLLNLLSTLCLSVRPGVSYNELLIGDGKEKWQLKW